MNSLEMVWCRTGSVVALASPLGASPAQKGIFTNAPWIYADCVLRRLGIASFCACV